MLPSGIITFLFTDIQGSTPLWEQDPDGMEEALDLHNAILHEVIEAYGGIVFKIVGDEFQAAFVDPGEAVQAAVAGQRNLKSAAWGRIGPLLVRMGIHTGYAVTVEEDYAVAHTLNRAARIMSAADGGQILISIDAIDQLETQLPASLSLVDLGRHRMKGMSLPEHLFELDFSERPSDSQIPELSAGFNDKADYQLDIDTLQTKSKSRPPAFLGEISEPIAVPVETFIGRENELSRLDQLLVQAIAGRGQVVLLTGEAGRGKTSLLNEFSRRALDIQPTLIVASGTCSIFTGIGDPYLPFREVLGMLTSDIETQFAAGNIGREQALRLWRFMRDVVPILVELGPHLIDTLVTAPTLKHRVARVAPEQATLLEDLREALDQRSTFGGEQTSDQSRIFEEFWDVLAALASRHPLLIVLDDLHWADQSSISLLSYLAVRVTDSPVMLLGAYRSEDVALNREGQRHPLAAVLGEFKRRFGNIWIDLDRDAKTLGQTFVDALLDTESNQLSEHFWQKLFHHTGGHPLFTVELLRDMQARGGLQKNEAGQWIEGSALSWEELPVRIEGVIETRIGRLSAEQQEALSVASVEGEEFTAEIIARVLARDGWELTRSLSGDLERQYRLVQEQGIHRVGTQRLSLFRFRHNLFRKYLYDSLSNSERMYLH